MAGRPFSTYSTAGSAADAYNTHRPQQHSIGQAHDTELGGNGMYDSRATNAAGYTVAHDDDDDDQDWNVYDDFNMARPLSQTASNTDAFQSSTQGYWDASNPNAAAAHMDNNHLDTPYSDYPKRKSLLNSESFGFDVKNSDPRKQNPTVLDRNANPTDHRQSLISAAPTPKLDPSSGIELITVPALGAEYSKAEMREMTRKDKTKKKRHARKKGFQLWVHGQDHICGWLSPRVAVFLAFLFCCALGICLFFVIPRVPSFAFLTTDPVSAVPNGASMQVSHRPTNFSMDMDLNLRADNMGGWIASHVKDITVQVTDLNTFQKVGQGSIDSFTFPGRKKTVFKLPVHLSYVSLNSTGDTTFLDFYKGCGPVFEGSARPTLGLGIKLSMKISGLVGTKETSTSINNLACPFTLQNYQ